MLRRRRKHTPVNFPKRVTEAIARDITDRMYGCSTPKQLRQLLNQIGSNDEYWKSIEGLSKASRIVQNVLGNM